MNPSPNHNCTALARPEAGGATLQWTENMPPSEACPYDHCVAQTPFGQFRITWKSWKKYQGVTVETPWDDWSLAFHSVSEAKASCQRALDERLARWGCPCSDACARSTHHKGIMSYPDYRALCAELADELESWLQAMDLGGYPPQDGANATLISRARAALAQPEAAGMTDEESFALWKQMESGMNEPPYWRDFDDFARAYAARWGRAAIAQPEAMGPTDDEWDTLWDKESEYFALHAQARRFGRAVLARWGRAAIAPVPVSDRPWQRDGWCDPAGRCWFHSAGREFGDWYLLPVASITSVETHSLPYWSIPLPQSTAPEIQP